MQDEQPDGGIEHTQISGTTFHQPTAFHAAAEYCSHQQDLELGVLSESIPGVVGVTGQCLIVCRQGLGPRAIRTHVQCSPAVHLLQAAMLSFDHSADVPLTDLLLPFISSCAQTAMCPPRALHLVSSTFTQNCSIHLFTRVALNQSAVRTDSRMQ